MRIGLVTPHFYPTKTSAAAQIEDLAAALHELGHEVVVMVPSSNIQALYQYSKSGDVELLLIKAPKIIDIGLLRRTVNEFCLPFVMYLNFRRSRFRKETFDLVAWYSPSIFLGIFVYFISRHKQTKTYLILRDIFPEWTVHLGVMRKGVLFYMLKLVANFQYAFSDIIGIQSHSNIDFLKYWKDRNKRIEVLNNWQRSASKPVQTYPSGRIASSNKKTLVYAGNMGIAQDVTLFVDLAKSLQSHAEYEFIFVGRGSEVTKLRQLIAQNGLSNTEVLPEMERSDLEELLSNCFLGLLSLDVRHRTHNIPGKFLTYLKNELPVLAHVNESTDLMKIINEKNVGLAVSGFNIEAMKEFIERLNVDENEYKKMKKNCIQLSIQDYTAEVAARQIVNSISSIKLK